MWQLDDGCPALKTLFVTGTQATGAVVGEVRSHVSVHR